MRPWLRVTIKLVCDSTPSWLVNSLFYWSCEVQDKNQHSARQGPVGKLLRKQLPFGKHGWKCAKRTIFRLNFLLKLVISIPYGSLWHAITPLPLEIERGYCLLQPTVSLGSNLGPAPNENPRSSHPGTATHGAYTLNEGEAQSVGLVVERHQKTF